MMGPVTDETNPTGTDSTLAADIDACCRLSGEFTLRSGQVASEYFDKYLFESDPVLLGRVADQMLALLPEDTELLGGLELGGIPIVTALSMRRSEEHTSELQSLMRNSYDVFSL